MCGRPLTEEAAAADAPQRIGRMVPREGETLQTLAPPITVRNAQALRAAYFPALLAVFLSNLPWLSFLFFLWYPLSGFLCVSGYRRRTGLSPNVGDGAKLGAITGAISSAVSLLMGVLNSLFPGDRPDLSQLLREQMEQMPAEDEIRRQVLQIIDDPATLGALVFFAVLVILAVSIGLSVAGGAVGAKVLKDD